MKIVEVTPMNLHEETLFCIKDSKSEGFQIKAKWYSKRYAEGLRIKILKNHKDKPIAFIEYVSANLAWRPVDADNYMFIHCMFTYSNKDRNRGYGELLISDCEKEARLKNMEGVVVMTSYGTWITDKRIFEKIGYLQVDSKGRFELMVKLFNKNAKQPTLIDWTKQQPKYKGWNLVYSDQCPWHGKAVEALYNTALDYGIDLKISKINSPAQARKAPSGFGTFSLLRNGRLLEDHYISATRFRNILKKELT